MHGFSARFFGGGKNARDVQIAFLWRRCADHHGFIRHFHMQRGGVDIGVDGNGADAEPATSLYNPAGDFSAIGNQQFFEHFYVFSKAFCCWNFIFVYNCVKRRKQGKGSFRQYWFPRVPIL